MKVEQLIALLPDDDTVVRYFNSPRSDQKVAPFVIARNVTSSEFGALLDALETAAEPPVYWADLDLDFNGTLQIPEISSIWHNCVEASITAQLACALTNAGLPYNALIGTGGGRIPERGQRHPDGNWIPYWTEDEIREIRERYPDSARYLGTLILEVAFSETSEHLHDKIVSTWMTDKSSLFPLLIMTVDFVDCGSEQALLDGAPIRMLVNLYKREGDQFQNIQTTRIGPDSCSRPGSPECEIRLPTKELLFGRPDVTAQTIVIDMFYIMESLEQFRQRKRQ